ncbi:DNA polymerase/3'-5' exonuclease PolX [bacterium]|nr:DNA polymerase/3'-5' exonuclease PolX [bacterium]
MPVQNKDIAEIFSRIADLLDIKNENPFRIRAYRQAAQMISGLSRNVRDMVDEGKDLSSLSGIGKDLAGKIETIVRSGNLPQLKKLEKEVPGELIDLMQLPEMGPKRVKKLYHELGIDSLGALKKAALNHKIRELEGFGEKTEDKIVQSVERWQSAGGEKRFLLIEAEQVVEPLIKMLREIEGVREVEVAGSYRRRKETVGDLDILVTRRKGTPVMERFAEYEDVKEVVAKGEAKTSVRLRSGFQVDLRVFEKSSYGAAMVYFTGSKDHNVSLRKMAKKENLKINEYGVFRGDKSMAGETEASVYEILGLQWIPPELRENRGEIEATQKGELPELITLEDMQGDLQCHSKASDGKDTIEDMAKAAKEKGYNYLAITDHSKRVSVANGLDADRLRRHMEDIDQVNEQLGGIHVLKGVEVDILKNGKLDLPDDVLEKLDVVVASTHYYRDLPRKEQTERIIRALDNPHVHILAHPFGRIINKRDPIDMDFEKILEAVKERNCFIEINAQPDRLDLSDVHAKMAGEMGIKLTISTDAHSMNGLNHMKWGVAQARRAWLTAEDVLNTRSWRNVKKLLKRD